jgi:hypothetical protein
MAAELETTPIGITNFRNTNRRFGIKDSDRLGHIYVIGKTGVGKSTLLSNMAMSDILRGKGLAVIDPHGDIAKTLVNSIPGSRRQDLVYIDPMNGNSPVAFNPLHAVSPAYHHLVASGLVSTFRKIWGDSWGPRMEYILRFTLLTLLNFPEATLLDIQPLLTDPGFRASVLSFVSDTAILSFWEKEFEKYSPRLRSEAISPILNKMGLFITSIPLRRIVGQKTTTFRMQQVLDGGKILIANLSKGQMGEDASSLLGCMLVTSIQLAAMHRAKQDEERRRPFYLYIDECHSFITLSFTDIFAEARKYKLSLFITHQYINQLQEPIRKAIFGNVGTIICFRVGSEDAEYLVKEFYPVFTQSDFINLPKYSMYIKLMIDGTSSNPFSANTVF